MEEFDPSQYREADRREVNPPIGVESATWSAAAQLDWWVRDAENGSVAYAGQTDINGGSRLLIFVWRTDNSFDLSTAVSAG
jgi:hypothetical protein